MKKIITLVLVALSFYSCTDSIGDNVTQDCGDIKNIPYESFTYCGEFKEKPTAPIYIILDSAEEINKRFTTCETFAVVLPDFTQKRILGLCSGPKPSNGYDIKIQTVVENDCQIIVEYFEKEPAQGENITIGVTYPTNFVILPKSDKPILFSRVNPIVDYAIVGSYVANPAATQCTGDCNQFYKIEKYKVVKYLNTNFPTVPLAQASYKALSFMDDYEGFLLKVPTEIKNVKGQTKTYGTPGTDDHGGVYFEWSQAGVITKIYLDSADSADQTPDIIAFKKVIQDKIVALKIKS
jgi:hypothetical protein